MTNHLAGQVTRARKRGREGVRERVRRINLKKFSILCRAVYKIGINCNSIPIDHRLFFKISKIWKTTSMEDYLNWIRPQSKMTLMEDTSERRWNIFSIEASLNWRWPEWKINWMEDSKIDSKQTLHCSAQTWLIIIFLSIFLSFHRSKFSM